MSTFVLHSLYGDSSMLCSLGDQDAEYECALAFTQLTSLL